jgi:glutaryl-CoA dehydrogenase
MISVDYFNIEDLLSSEEILVRDTIAKFVDEKVKPILNHYYQMKEFPMELIAQLADLNVFGAYLDGYDCANMSSVEYGLIMQELERADSALRGMVSVHSSLAMWPIWKFGTEQQKEKWLPKMAAGEAIGCFALTEPTCGSYLANMKTEAVKLSDKYVLNGRKTWITNGSIADIAIVWANLEGRIRGFIVEKEEKGLTIVEPDGRQSLEALSIADYVFNDCTIPADNILPGTDDLKSALECLTQGRYGVAWGALGAALDCYSTALNYSKMRYQFNRPLASFQLVQDKLAYMVTEITKAQLLALQLGRLNEQGKMKHTQASMAKMNNVKMALDVARLSRDILGANGITNEYPVMRHLKNLESVNTYEGTHDIHRLIIGYDITGIAAFS